MLRFWIIPFGLAFAATLFFRQSDSLKDTILMWLAAINAVAFLTYLYDKVISKTKRTRVPEIVLLALAFAGGWPVAFLSMQFLGHKTSAEKARFRLAFWLLVIVEIVLVLVYVWPLIGSAFAG